MTQRDLFEDDPLLNPCKKCGGDAVIENRGYGFSVKCQDCNNLWEYSFPFEDRAILMWNHNNVK